MLGDSAYGSGEFRNHLNDRDMTAVIKPGPLRPAVEGGFTIDDFVVTDTAVSCPAGVTVSISPKRHARFGRHCTGCTFRSRCTKSRAGRSLHLHPHHALLVAARRQARTDDFADVYRQHRPMVERTIAWLMRRGHRKVRYRGIERNQIALGVPRPLTQVSGFAHSLDSASGTSLRTVEWDRSDLVGRCGHAVDRDRPE